MLILDGAIRAVVIIFQISVAAQIMNQAFLIHIIRWIKVFNCIIANSVLTTQSELT